MTADKITTYNLTSSAIKRRPENVELDRNDITVESIVPLSLGLLYTNDVKKFIQI